MITSQNKNITEMLRCQKRTDGQIIDGIYIAIQYLTDSQKLLRIYFGGHHTGPLLSYTEDGLGAYNGTDRIDYLNGCWTPLYSRGNYGKRYAFGGNWTSQCKDLIGRLNVSPAVDKKYDIILLDGGGIVSMPDGISTGLTMTDMDCSVGWSISYPTAADAMAMRLTRAEIAEAKLPIEAKQLLDADNAAREIDRLNEVIAIYKL